MGEDKAKQPPPPSRSSRDRLRTNQLMLIPWVLHWNELKLPFTLLVDKCKERDTSLGVRTGGWVLITHCDL